MRSNAAEALGSWPAAVPNLLCALEKDSNHFVRISAAYALGQLKDKSSVAGLIKSLENDPVKNVRTQSAVALSWILREKAQVAIPVLEHAQRTYDIDEDGDSEWVTREALERIRGQPDAEEDSCIVEDED